MPTFAQQRSAERRLEEGTANDGIMGYEDYGVVRVSSWAVVKAILYFKMFIVIAGLSFVKSMGLVPNQGLGNHGAVFRDLFLRYLTDPYQIIEDSRFVIGGMSKTVDVLEHVLQDSTVVASVVEPIARALPRRRRT